MDTFLTQLSSTVSTRTLESTAPEPASTPASPTSDRIGRFLHVVIEPRSYLNALYMLIAFPLGLTYFLVLVGGAITGAFTGIILVGLLFLLATLAAAWGFALLERELVIVLLGVDVPPHSLPDTELVSPWRMLVRHLRQPTTWRSMVYLLIRLPFGIFATLLAGILLGPSLTGIIFPIGRLMSEGPSPLAIGNLIVPGAPAVVGLAISFHILNAVGRTWGRFAADMLRVSAAETRRLSDLIEDLLMLARADSQELKVANRAVEVGPIVEQVVQALAPLARNERQVTVNLDDLPARIWATGDPDRLAQVLTNLVRNAINYTPEGGVVSIRLTSGADHVQIAVSDTGLGISAEDLEHIFERFYRADSSRTRDTGGFGLGLSIARELVDAMGGSLSASSDFGLGSTFWISLRRAEPN